MLETNVHWLWGYSNRISGTPGDPITLHLSGTARNAVVEIARIGKDRQVVHRLGPFSIGLHEVPENPHIVGCGWPVAATFQIGNWPTGYYELLFSGDDGAQSRHMLVVRPSRRSTDVALVLSTNTYQAYNCWGGANSYVWVGGPHPAAKPSDTSKLGPARILSAHRPFSAGQMQPRSPRHRIVTPAPRGFMQSPGAGEIWEEAGAGGEIQDCPAGYVDKWEHAFVAWAETEGYRLDFLTDADLDSDPTSLEGYKVVVCVGHSEYWTWDQRTQVESFVERGGGLAIFSGNTCYWQCRWEDDHSRLVVYKSAAEDSDPLASDPARRHLLTSMWSHPATGKPEAALTGLSFLFGGYHRFGNCVARGSCGYTVLRENHWALRGTDLYWGDVFGAECRLVGFEVDGAPFTIGADGYAHALPRLGVPPDLDIIAYAPASLFEPVDQPYSPIALVEALPTIAKAMGMENNATLRDRLRRGHALMATFGRGAGEVFNGGTTEWAYALAGRNPYVDRITRNVLDRFLA
jgi:hypothetical protein